MKMHFRKEDGESWWQIGKNGRTLFNRPKPTIGCSANGRRRRSISGKEEMDLIGFENKPMVWFINADKTQNFLTTLNAQVPAKVRMERIKAFTSMPTTAFNKAEKHCTLDACRICAMCMCMHCTV
jgi:hypothetical protein